MMMMNNNHQHKLVIIRILKLSLRFKGSIIYNLKCNYFGHKVKILTFILLKLLNVF